MKYMSRNGVIFVILIFMASLALVGAWTKPLNLTVMTFNIWGGGLNANRSIDETVAVIKTVNPDIIGIQETRKENSPCTAEYCVPSGQSVTQQIASKLGYFYYEQSKNNPALWANAILSRYPIESATPNDLGVLIRIKNRTIYAFNIHFTDYPCQPYQLLNIPYGKAEFLKNANEAVEAAKKTRGPALDLLMHDLKLAEKADAVFLFGDVNEPSFRDWTDRAARIKRHPMAVPYPSTRRIEQEGNLIDLLRIAHPDEITHPDFTWPVHTSDPITHHDRIDYVFGRAKNLKVIEACVVGDEKSQWPILPWPSDHRAVMAKVQF